jgi:hypothetical protein
MGFLGWHCFQPAALPIDPDKDVADHSFAIQFLDPGVQAFAFTFG